MEQKYFWPLMTYSSPSLRARVVMVRFHWGLEAASPAWLPNMAPFRGRFGEAVLLLIIGESEEEV